ncbi:MAG TPA: ABC transporter permease [Patescibacteria group bacterium]|nr:ABC transporter permease [Patescibacteria group bacterium]
MDTLWQDIRFGARVLARNPAFASLAVLTLALAIGANTAVFSILDAVMLRSLPVADPGRLVVLTDPDSHGSSYGSDFGERSLLAWADFEFLRSHNEVFSSMFASDSSLANRAVSIGGPSSAASVSRSAASSQQLETATFRLVSGNYFSTLGVQPILGRGFSPEMDRSPGGAPYAVISYAYWNQRFGLDPQILGRTIRVRQTTLEIIGVTPPGFFGETVGDAPDVWLPITMQDTIYPGIDRLTPTLAITNQYIWLQVLARLKPGVSLSQANASINVTFRQEIEEALRAPGAPDYRQRAFEQRIKLRSGLRGASTVYADYGDPIKLLMGMVGLILLIACANLANFLLARGAARQKEFAVRMAIGSGRLRLVRQLVTECALLALLGGAAGFLFSRWAAPLLVSLAGSTVPGSSVIDLDLTPDVRVAFFTLAVTLLTVLLFGLFPALRAARLETLPVLRAAATGSSQGQRRIPAGRLLVVAQVSISIVMLTACGLFLRTLQQLRGVNLGYNRDNLLMFRVDAAAAGHSGDSRVPFFRDVLDKIRALPGVRVATLSSNGLFQHSESADPVSVEGHTPKPGEDLHAMMDHVGPGYFSALGIPLLAGREITEQDAAPSRRVCVINRTFAEKYFHGSNPLGKIIRDTYPGNPGDAVVVGVVADSKSNNLREGLRARVYFPFFNEMWLHTNAGFEVRTFADAAAVSREIRNAVAAAAPAHPAINVFALNSLVGQSISTEVFITQLSGLLALLALALAGIGLYGLMAYTVSRRTREIGIRMALGARRETVLWMVLRETMVLIAVGFAVGVPAAVAGSLLLRSLLFGVGAGDPIALVGAMLVLAGIAAFAGFLPARRAARVDPMIALRYE